MLTKGHAQPASRNAVDYNSCISFMMPAMQSDSYHLLFSLNIFFSHKNKVNLNHQEGGEQMIILAETCCYSLLGELD